jgi:hypothetical protein
LISLAVAFFVDPEGVEADALSEKSRSISALHYLELFCPVQNPIQNWQGDPAMRAFVLGLPVNILIVRSAFTAPDTRNFLWCQAKVSGPCWGERADSPDKPSKAVG